jgi:hypothetical protein
MTNETHVITRATSAAAAKSSACPAVRWILIERCPDVNRHPEAKTPEGTETNDSVRGLLAQMERPFLQGGGGVSAMILPQGPHVGAVVEIRSVRRGDSAASEPEGYAPPQILGWGGPEEVGSILRCNEILLRDLAFPETGVTVSCEYYYGTRM